MYHLKKQNKSLEDIEFIPIDIKEVEEILRDSLIMVLK
jgi:hypothetical protein